MNGAPLVALKDVCTINPSKREAKAHPSDLQVSFMPMEDLRIGEKYSIPLHGKPIAKLIGSYTYFCEGDVLLAKITPCFENGKLGIAKNLTNGIGFGSSEYIVFRPAASLDAEYLYYFLARDEFRKLGATHMSGAVGHKRVSKDFIETTQIPLPPLSVQKAIVTTLDAAFASIDTAITAADKNAENAEQLFQSYLSDAFDRGGKGSEYVALSSITEVITDGDHQPPPKAKEGIPFITISNVNKETREIDFSDTFKVPLEYFQALKHSKRPLVGDVLYTVTGSYGIPIHISAASNFCFQRHIGLIRPSANIHSRWLFWLMSSSQVREQADACANGAAQLTVSLKSIRNFQVPLMSLDKQVQLSNILDDTHKLASKLQTVYRRRSSCLMQLKQSILQQAFSGQLVDA